MSTPIHYPRPRELEQLGTRHAVVEASAGTGKTFLLEHLVVELLLNHGARMEEILVVTFTERATAELCLRLRNKLSELCHVDSCIGTQESSWLIDDIARARLRDALLAFDRATISTIHGFCRGILGDHAFLHRRMFDEQAIDEKDAFHSAFVEALRCDFAVDPALQPYLQTWLSAGHSATDLEDALAACATELARIFPPRPRALQPDLDEAAVTAAIAAWPAEAACDPALIERLKKAKVHARTAAAVGPRLATLTEILLKARGAETLAPVLAALEHFVANDSQPDVWAYLLGALDKGAADPHLCEVRQALANLVDVTPPLLAALAHKFLPRVNLRLQARKRAAGLYDFQDMLTLVAQSLTDQGAPTLLSTLRGRYKYALIDEFQDTDEVQWSIFRRLFFESKQGHVLTVIGDPKQAIYRFRGADVHTYLRARGEILQAGGALVKLAQNFRSTAAVIDGYNALFDRTVGFFRSGSGIDYDRPVTCGRPDRRLLGTDGEARPGVVVFDLQASEPLVGDLKRALRRQMVDEIRRLLSGDGTLVLCDGDKVKRIAAGDIFVLAFTNPECREIGEALRVAGLPFAFYKGDDLFQSDEAKDVLDLLRAIAEPYDHTLRARAFLTGFFALDLCDLAQRDCPDESDPLLGQLLDWHQVALTGDFGALFAQILARSRIVCREVGLDRSERAMTNTLHIFEVLQEEAARTHATLRELVEALGAYVNGTRLPPGDERNVQRLESDAQAVQVMTVHKAKGLEADVVFIYGGLSHGRSGGLSVFHDHEGQRVVRIGPIAAEESESYANEIGDEDRRLLYVALTRARGRLYLPLYPEARRPFPGPYRLIRPILDRLIEDRAGLFHRVPVACPGEEPLVLPAPAPAALANWQPPPLPTSTPAAEFRRIAKERSGFVVTSYTGVKRRHGGFVVPEEPADLTTANEPIEQAAAPVDPRELERGRLSGIFLHAVLEKVPLDDVPVPVSSADWADRPEIAALLLSLARRHERNPAQIAHAAHLVHTALFTPLRLGSCLVPGLGLARPSLREVEFLYPIPERHHPLLAERGRARGEERLWSIERGLVKGFIDYLFEHKGRIYLCDWKGDWLPAWAAEQVRAHCENNYEIQARLYTLAVLRLAGIDDRDSFDRRFGGVLYCFLRGMRAGDKQAGIYFRRPDWQTVLGWQAEMLGNMFWGIT